MTEDPVIVRPMIFGFAEGGAIRSRIARRSSRWRGFQSLLLVALLVVAQPAAADEATCGSLRYRHGPYDYRTSAWARNWAEKYHFTPEVEQLKKGASTSYIGQDLDFVLLAIPNHSRALAAMVNWKFKTKKDPPTGATYSVDCYFDRAIRFSPDDGAVRAVYGVYLMRVGKTADAVAQLEMAAKLGEDTANMHYNIGLAYFELRDYDKALAHAKKAYEQGFTLPGLRDKLTQAGKWQAQ